MSELNVPLLRKAVEWVEEQAARPRVASEWNQHSWIEPADVHARRVAAEMLGGGASWYDLSTQKLAEELAPSCGTAYCVAGYIGQMHEPRYQQHEDVKNVHVSTYAADLLGLDDDQARDLFASHNTAEDVRAIAEEIAGERL